MVANVVLCGHSERSVITLEKSVKSFFPTLLTYTRFWPLGLERQRAFVPHATILDPFGLEVSGCFPHLA